MDKNKKGRIILLPGLFSVFIILSLVIGLSHISMAQQGPGYRKQRTFTPPKDERQLVSMPDGVKLVLRLDMISHLSALNEILVNISTGDLDAAAEVAELKLGKSSMGKHRGTGMGPGRFMPQDMHDIAFSMHQAASSFAELAKKKGDLKGVYEALQEITAHCVSCHSAYRIQ
ncbi:MAG: cytochrome c [Deltaproteobacteria bacterium]|nr:cytochrome c [Deltaproteobacteria bacterium]